MPSHELNHNFKTELVQKINQLLKTFNFDEENFINTVRVEFEGDFYNLSLEKKSSNQNLIFTLSLANFKEISKPIIVIFDFDIDIQANEVDITLSVANLNPELRRKGLTSVLAHQSESIISSILSNDKKIKNIKIVNGIISDVAFNPDTRLRSPFSSRLAKKFGYKKEPDTSTWTKVYKGNLIDRVVWKLFG